MKRILFICFGIFLFFNLKAQNDTIRYKTPKNEKPHYLGVNAGLTTGIGLSYMYCPRKNGIQATFLPLIDKDYARISAAISFFRFFSEGENARFFVYLGNHLTNFSTSDESFFYNIGIGPGVEGEKDFFKVRVSIGYALLAIPSNTMSRPTAELGLFFTF